MKKSLFMETTMISPEKTAGEIIAALVASGATQVNMEYEKGSITGLRWMMPIASKEALFSMPARVDPVFAILRSRNRNSWMPDREKETLMAKARRVAWRQLLRWTLAQLAMIECGMTEASEVFFPYLQHPDSGRSIFEHFKETGFNGLPAPNEKRLLP